MSVVRLLLHAVSAFSFAWSIFYMRTMDGRDETFGGSWKFLTFWNLWLQLAFCIVCIVNMVVYGRSTDKDKGSPKEDFLFSSLAFPYGVFVAAMFWALYAIDRELVYPEALDKIIPTYVNHMMHTVVAPLQVYEMVFVRRSYPSRKSGAAVCAAFGLSYVAWIHVVAAKTGLWVYPLLGILSTQARIAFIVFSAVLNVALYVFGERINCVVWGADKSKAKAAKAK